MIKLEETIKYRVSTEAEVSELIETARTNQPVEGYELTKHTSTYKTKKLKGEVVDDWYVVSITKRYSEEK